MLGTSSMGDVPIGEDGPTLIETVRPLPYWVTIVAGTADDIVGRVAMDSIRIDQSAREVSTCSYEVINPYTVPVVGQPTSVWLQDNALFGCLIQHVSLMMGPDETVRRYRVEARRGRSPGPCRPV